jgi:hypothetical protein
MTASQDKSQVQGEGVHEAARRYNDASTPSSVPTTEDESADPVGDGHSDADFAAQSPLPGRPNPAPDEGEESPDDDHHHKPSDDDDDAPKTAGRDNSLGAAQF